MYTMALAADTLPACTQSMIGQSSPYPAPSRLR